MKIHRDKVSKDSLEPILRKIDKRLKTKIERENDGHS